MENKVPKIILQSGFRRTRPWVLLSIIGVLLLFINQNVFAQTPVPCTGPDQIIFTLVGVDATSSTANDAKIRISGALSGNNKVGYSVGTTYTGPNFAAATKISDLTNSYISETLPTPTNQAGTDYTIRVYSADGSCYTDKTFKLEYVNFNETPKQPDISVAVTRDGDEYVALNGTVTVTVAVSNTGTATATGVVYTIGIPPGFTAVTGTTATGTYSGTTWTIGNLPAGGQPVTLKLTGTVSTRGVKYVTANLSAEIEQDVDSSPTTDYAGEDDQGSICISTPFDYCSNDAYTVTLPNYKGVKWFKDGVEIIFDPQGNSSITTVKRNTTDSSLVILGVGVYSYTKLVGQGACLSGDCCPVKVEPGKPPVLVALTNQSICLDATFIDVIAQNTETAPNSPFIYQWYNNNGANNADTLAINGQTSLTFTAKPTAVGVYNYKLKAYEQDHKNCAAETTITLTIRDIPVISIAPVKPVCAEDTISLNIVGTVTGDTYSWTGPQNFVASVANPDRLNATTDFAGTYSVTVSNVGACSATASVAVVVNELPPAPKATDIEVCAGDTPVELSAAKDPANPGNTLLWYTVASGGSGSPVAPTPPVATAGISRYYVSQTDANGCISHRDTLVLTINAKPDAPKANPVTYCQFAKADSLVAIADAQHTIYWYGQNATGGTASLASPTPSTDVVTTLTFYASQKDDRTGCESNRAPAVVNINTTPGAPTIEGITYCEGDAPKDLALQIKAKDNGTTLEWYTSGTPSNTPPSVNTSVAGLTMFYVSQKVSGTGCESGWATIPVTVNPKPVATVIAVNALCVGSVSQDNAQLVLTRYRNTDKVSYIIGSTYNDQTATAFVEGSTLTGGVFASNLPNPTGADQAYTVRIKNSFDCTIDRIATITQKKCDCPGGYCEPATVTKTK
ncbi:DUF11 domain-containing protein [Emticicia sp. C21]|uniref:Ig-like domain-containing protein n=1 Tax=Emticicia sp. C21 TaxID=2302915 RepID=UPI000E345C66|nr:DUF11 domain-containing protein [Emticicia sp. C21]RFS14188.1 DUF11 domain-containing protein [Emticicia sp. C21]